MTTTGPLSASRSRSGSHSIHAQQRGEQEQQDRALNPLSILFRAAQLLTPYEAAGPAKYFKAVAWMPLGPLSIV